MLHNNHCEDVFTHTNNMRHMLNTHPCIQLGDAVNCEVFFASLCQCAKIKKVTGAKDVNTSAWSQGCEKIHFELKDRV